MSRPLKIWSHALVTLSLPDQKKFRVLRIVRSCVYGLINLSLLIGNEMFGDRDVAENGFLY